MLDSAFRTSSMVICSGGASLWEDTAVGGIVTTLRSATETGRKVMVAHSGCWLLLPVAAEKAWTEDSGSGEGADETLATLRSCSPFQAGECFIEALLTV